MKHILKILMIVSLIISTITTSSYAENKKEITPKEYNEVIETYIKNDKIEKINDAPWINFKAIKNGMNLGYLHPKVQEIKENKENIDTLITSLSVVSSDNEQINDINEDLVSKLEVMYEQLDKVEEEYSNLIRYDRTYLRKFVSLKFNLLDDSPDHRLREYNKYVKEVNRIYKDINRLVG